MYQTSFLSSLPIDPLNEGHMSLTAKSITAKLTDQDILLLKRHVLSQQCMSFLGLLPSGWLHHTIDCLLDRTWVYASNTPGVGLILPGSHLSFKYMNEIKKNSQTFHHLQTSCSLKNLLLPFSFRFFLWLSKSIENGFTSLIIAEISHRFLNCEFNFQNYV